MGFYIFARFHAREGQERALEEALRANLEPTRAEPGCRHTHLYRSIRDRGLFYIHSQFVDEAAFELHAGLPHTMRMVERVTPLIDHPFEATRAEEIG
jgi:quinol monooxygenase YgiN